MFEAIRQAITGYARELKQVRDAIERASREREDLLFAPPSKADLAAALERWHTANVQRYRSLVAASLAKLRTNREALDDLTASDDLTALDTGLQHLNLFGLIRSGPGGVIASETTAIEQSMLGLFGDSVYRILLAEVDKMPALPDELSTAERSRRLTKIDAELKTLRAKEETLVTAAEEAGINVEAVG
ncbi:hypothetical protein [Xylophilus ampelinus]|uniref:Uncharacterized protein n=1 Tax=Xylophilus ampelinus TaxID=54067 RepID=A0A318SFX6_9BURK|nr:hypothetical protein [Xylophilus ampelinus]MCS4511130.1 hypothetical protein [Xylophilus ampelinus]PYE75880.1 hypothetical protein DFQ15_1185 [Xylophilus ampelinus]